MITLDECADLLSDAPNGLAFLRAWKRWRGEDLVPPTGATKPEELGSALPCMMVLEVQARDKIMIRLAGTRLHDVLGRDVTGENLVDLAAPSQREHRMETYSNYASYPCGVKWSSEVVRASGLSTSVRGLALPVRPPASEDPMRVYAAFDFAGDLKEFEKHPYYAIPAADDRAYVDIGCGAPD